MMKNKMKKFTAALLMGVMLFGGVLTAHAATGIGGVSPHVSEHPHYKSRQEYVTTIRTVRTTHQYVDSSGNTCECTVTTELKEYADYCWCNYYMGSHTEVETSHSASHSN